MDARDQMQCMNDWPPAQQAQRRQCTPGRAGQHTCRAATPPARAPCVPATALRTPPMPPPAAAAPQCWQGLLRSWPAAQTPHHGCRQRGCSFHWPAATLACTWVTPRCPLLALPPLLALRLLPAAAGLTRMRVAAHAAATGAAAAALPAGSAALVQAACAAWQPSGWPRPTASAGAVPRACEPSGLRCTKTRGQARCEASGSAGAAKACEPQRGLQDCKQTLLLRGCNKSVLLGQAQPLRACKKYTYIFAQTRRPGPASPTPPCTEKCTRT